MIPKSGGRFSEKIMRKQNVAIAILAKAPVPGLTKTRLIPSIGAHAAAILQERLTERAVATALAAAVGPVTLWCAPDPGPVSYTHLRAHETPEHLVCRLLLE